MKNILYIHGLDSSPKESKMSVIKIYGNVLGLQLNYRQDTDAFTKLSKAIEDNQITHIIGSSMGGYLGFYLAHKYHLPCLLFNPALKYRSIEVWAETTNNKCPHRLIILGAKDTTVNSNDTISFLKACSAEALSQEIIINQNLEHQIPLDVFKNYVHFFLNNSFK